MNKILCIGEALIDMICTDKNSSLSDGEHFLKKAGGAPTNVAAAIAALGGNVTIAAKVGKDPFGHHLIQVLQDFGVSTNAISFDANHFTTLAFVSLMENGERDFYFNRGADGRLSKDDLLQIDLSLFSIAHFGSATAFLPGPLQSTYEFLLNESIKQNHFISFDPNYRSLLFGNNKKEFIRRSKQFIQQSQFFKLSDEEAFLISGQNTVSEAAAVLRKMSNAVFAITIGKDGTCLGINDDTFIVPSIQVNAIDTTGAGDAFVGAVLFQLSGYTKNEIQQLDHNSWTKIISNANKAGARTCEYMGAMEAFKHLSTSIFNA
ncbi:MAG: carbohydrate kinase family protein [Bacteroidota bacterium]